VSDCRQARLISGRLSLPVATAVPADQPEMFAIFRSGAAALTVLVAAVTRPGGEGASLKRTSLLPGASSAMLREN
jgi:hypothetical protein